MAISQIYDLLASNNQNIGAHQIIIGIMSNSRYFS